MKIIAATEAQAIKMVELFNDYSEMDLAPVGREIEVDMVELDMLIDALAFNGYDLDVIDTLDTALEMNANIALL